MQFLKLSVLVCLLIGSSVDASDPCTFARDALVDQVRNFAQQFPGSILDGDDARATWILSDSEQEFFEMGGCYDLGAAAGRLTNMDSGRTFAQVIDAVRDLGPKYLPESEWELLAHAVNEKSYERDESLGVTFLFVSHPAGGEIVVVHSFSEGEDLVRIEWPLNL